MTKSVLPKDFIEKAKDILTKKDKELKEDQENLVKNDPYLQEGRASEGSELMEEATNEDVQKNITDARLGMISRVRLQVRKALAAINIGTYGVCEDCSEKIDKARLRAYPEATLCIRCAEDESQRSETE